MMRVVLAQYVVAVLAALIGALIFNVDAGLSALLGGLSYAFMSTLLMLFLIVGRKMKISVGAGVMAMLLGEFVKILSVIVLLLVVAQQYDALNWPAFLISLIAVVNSYFVLLFKKKLRIGPHGSREP